MSDKDKALSILAELQNELEWTENHIAGMYVQFDTIFELVEGLEDVHK